MARRKKYILLAFCDRVAFLRLLSFSFLYILIFQANEALKGQVGNDPFCQDYPDPLTCDVISSKNAAFNIAVAPDRYAVCNINGTKLYFRWPTLCSATFGARTSGH